MHIFLPKPHHKNNSHHRAIDHRKPVDKISLILERFNTVLTDDIWQKILPYIHYSRDELFKKIYPKLNALLAKIKLSDITLLDLAFIIDEPPLTEFLIDIQKSSLTRETLDKAVLCDNTNALILLEKKRLSVDLKLMRFSAEHGCLACLKYCVAKGFLPDYSTLNEAALYGHIHVIKYLVSDLKIAPDLTILETIIIGSKLAPHGNAEAICFINDILAQERDKQNNQAMQLR